MACSSVSRCSGTCGRALERLLEGPHGLAVGRPRHGLLPRLPAVHQGLVPHLPPQSMVSQALDLLGHALPGECLQGLDDAGMQHPPSFLEQTAVGYFVGEGVLEGVFVVRKESRLVEKFGRLQVREATMQRLPRVTRRWPAARSKAPQCQ